MSKEELLKKLAEIEGKAVEVSCLVECLTHVDLDTGTHGRIHMNGALGALARLADDVWHDVATLGEDCYSDKTLPDEEVA